MTIPTFTKPTRQDEPPFTALPDHTDLPDTDGTFVQNFQEHPQAMLLSETLRPVLQHMHPDGNYAIGQDSGIYWNVKAAMSNTPVKGAVAPDWFYVPNVPPLRNAQVRRSYVLWYEVVAPFIVIEFVSGSGSEERDMTPERGKFWIYEQAIRASYYAIYEVDYARVTVYRLNAGRYVQLVPNERGHYGIEMINHELGIWQGVYENFDLPWLRWWDSDGNLLPTADERAETERQRAETERQRAETERQRAERFAAKLRAMGVRPEDLE